MEDSVNHHYSQFVVFSEELAKTDHYQFFYDRERKRMSSELLSMAFDRHPKAKSYNISFFEKSTTSLVEETDGYYKKDYIKVICKLEVVI